MTEYNPLAPTGAAFDYKKMDVGGVFKGVIVDTPKLFAHNEFGTDKQLTSRSGKPMWKVRVVVENDEGTHSLYLEKRAYWSFIKAVKDQGIRVFEDTEGYTFGIRRNEDIPSQTAGFAPAKDFDIKLVK